MKIDVVVNIVAEAVVGVNRNWELSRGEVGNLASENVENCRNQQKKSRDSEIPPTQSHSVFGKNRGYKPLPQNGVLTIQWF